MQGLNQPREEVRGERCLKVLLNLAIPVSDCVGLWVTRHNKSRGGLEVSALHRMSGQDQAMLCTC